MKIVIDTREQLPLKFNHPYITEIINTKLIIGDYSCILENGVIIPYYFERKSMSDLFGTMGKGYKRFKKEMIRAQENNIKLILIIEGSLLKVLKGSPHSTIEGIIIVKKLFTLWIRYGLISIFCKDREEMSEFIIQYFMAYGREKIRKR